MTEIQNGSLGVHFVKIDENHDGQRIDNFLLGRLKGVPKSRVYRILRKGEVRVNGSRAKAEYRLQVGDAVRIPPVRVAERDVPAGPSPKLQQLLEQNIVYEDAAFLVINKPAGLAVHGGSGVSLGLIESLRATRPAAPFLELVHRLDRETSGCLMIAKKRSMLRHLQEEMRAGRVVKIYQALCCGRWPKGMKRISAPLRKNELKSGERIVKVDPEGKASVTHFQVLHRYRGATLLEVALETGRTHQIRVHCQFAGCPLAGDEKYADVECNRQMREKGLKRMFLHAGQLKVSLPDGQLVEIRSPLPDDLTALLTNLE
ncbi:23S rRNA pseudouridine(955/2504/2580) synthase RluC [uncultured Porticoccus sp.]|uniref:23S rRNA pseudouridine(955/2504/2580) synthase RluC n=1 Tax=uncultured Porticoccus sp. TaxID=1256050 RepID=UPI002625824E|nr:23S rRNA pseudouridine(955/2504/2580) synthase RluC [uncultured Porticoccus sp.]|tara:strand:- start:356 stop:1303 length:948 start_codon:yes stop_codon:yes gene_type:complete